MIKRLFISSLPFVFCNFSQADSLSIDKIYHPYVNALEKEAEWRMRSADGQQQHKFALGNTVSNKLYLEAYLNAEERPASNKLRLLSYELEAMYQLTEQGEYSADWAVMMEVEKLHEYDAWEASTGIITEKQWHRWVGTANLWLTYEWGDNRNDEFETSLGLQARYRYSRFFEPAVELYSGQNTRAMGPVIMGDIPFAGRKNLHWESGVIFGLDDKTPDTTIRLLAEFEY